MGSLRILRGSSATPHVKKPLGLFDLLHVENPWGYVTCAGGDFVNGRQLVYSFPLER